MRKRTAALISLLLMTSGFAVSAAAPNIYAYAAKGELAKVKALLKNNVTLVNARDKEGSTPLHYAAAAGQKAMVEFLISQKAEVNARKKNGVTPLHAAAALGKKEVVGVLLAHRADISICDDKGRTPVTVAEANGRTEIVKMLLADLPKPAPVEPVKAPSAPKPADSSILTRQLVEMLSRGEFQAVWSGFGSTLKSTISAEGLQKTWESLIDQIGGYKGQLGIRKEKVDSQDSVIVTCQFEDAKLDIRFTYDASTQVTALSLLPVMP